MLKVRLSVLDAETEIEIKKDGDTCRLLVIASAGQYHREKGTAWHGTVEDEQALQQLESLISGAYHHPSKTERITMLDGISVHVVYESETGKLDFTFKDYSIDSQEELLLKQLFSLCNTCCRNEKLRKNLLLFEGFHKD